MSDCDTDVKFECDVSGGSGGGGERQSKDGGGRQNIDDGICRDFLRNVCHRGERCRFRHPTKMEAQAMGLKKPDLVFCHDFQNSSCRRPNCKFVHCTREEEEYYHIHGQLPDRMSSTVDRGMPLNDCYDDEDIPVCKDFLKGACSRASRCKFRHLTMREYERDVERRARMRAGCDGPPMYGVGAKRPGYMMDDGDMYGGGGGGGAGGQFARMEEENIMLRRRLADMEQRYASLERDREVLVQENKKLRGETSSVPPAPAHLPTQYPLPL